MKTILRGILIALVLLAIAAAVLRNYCPTRGLALTTQRNAFQLLKNRIAFPQQSDFDSRVTLEALLQPGDDQSRWSDRRAARIEGYVVAISSGPFEAANCYCRRDVHIMLALRPDAAPREQIVLEVTPRVEANQPAARGNREEEARDVAQLKDWSLETLQRELTSKRVRFEGWLFFDMSHAAESENTAPGRTNNWRATAWELHPVTKIEIVK